MPRLTRTDPYGSGTVYNLTDTQTALQKLAAYESACEDPELVACVMGRYYDRLEREAKAHDIAG
jgi:hypothetical protein